MMNCNCQTTCTCSNNNNVGTCYTLGSVFGMNSCNNFSGCCNSAGNYVGSYCFSFPNNTCCNCNYNTNFVCC